MSPTEFRKAVKKVQTIDPAMDTVMAMFFIFEYHEKLVGSTSQRIWNSLSFVEVGQGQFSTAKFYAIRAKLFKHMLTSLHKDAIKRLIVAINEV